MVEVCLIGKKDSNVFGTKPEFLNARSDLRGRIGKAGVDENVPGRVRDEEAAEILGADVVNASGNSMSGEWTRPLGWRPCRNKTYDG